VEKAEEAETAPEIVGTIDGIEVPAAPHFGPRMINAIAEGRFEKSERRAGLAAIPEGAAILELGAGSGIVGASLARNCRPRRILSIEANPELVPFARALHRHNRLDSIIELRHDVVVSGPDAPGEADFFVTGNFLGSGLSNLRKPEKSRRFSVPVIPYDVLRAEFPHDTIMMDIEGGERDFLRHADLAGVRLVIFETHRDIYGREGMRECRSCLAKAGFVMDPDLSGGGVQVWRRTDG
jgi:FkbM family methyltransferase